jgi:transposase
VPTTTTSRRVPPPTSNNHNNHNNLNMRSFGTEISGNRGRGCELSSAQRTAILEAVDAGKKKAAIAREFGCSTRVVFNTIQRWKDHKTVESLPRLGQPPKLNRVQKRNLLRIVRQHPQIEYAELIAQVAGIAASRSTIYRLIKKHHITKWRAKKRPKLTPELARMRLKWAKQHRRFN